MNDKNESHGLLTVLSLEDSESDFEIISKHLVSAGFTIEISRVENKDEFISSIRYNRYDIILADYNLPSFDAFSALEICKELCPGVPFICVSGAIGEDLAIELLKQGAVDYVLKDKLDRLPFTINRALGDAEAKKIRQEMEETIKQSEVKLTRAQEIAGMGSWDYNLITNRLSWSKNLLVLLGFDTCENEPAYNDFFNLVHPDDQYLIDLIMQELIRNKNTVTFDCRDVLPDGRTIWVQNNISPVFEHGKLTELHGVTIDVTEKKAAEQELIKAKEKAEAGDKLKSAFIHNISHEVRTPLSGIIGFSEMLLQPDLPPDQKTGFSEDIKKSSLRLLKTINGYMDISMIVSGNIQVCNKRFSVVHLLDEIRDEVVQDCREKGLDLSVLVPAGSDAYELNSDREILRKIFNYLVENAIKFTTRGSVRFGFRERNGRPEFLVADTGIGIDDEKAKIIFDYFMQADISISRGYEGSGLGLSIARGLVNILGGELFLESEVGKGSSFYFTIPDREFIS